MKTMQWSDVARAPRDVAAEVDASGEVRLERRGNNALIITSEEHNRLRIESLASVAAILTHLTRTDTSHLTEILSEALPWVDFLPEDEQTEFAREFAKTMQACSDIQVWAPFHRMLHEWRQTAAIHADPSLANALSTPLNEDFGTVIDLTDESEDAKDGSRKGRPGCTPSPT